MAAFFLYAIPAVPCQNRHNTKKWKSTIGRQRADTSGRPTVHSAVCCHFGTSNFARRTKLPETPQLQCKIISNTQIALFTYTMHVGRQHTLNVHCEKKWVLFLFAIAVRRVVCLVFMAIAPDTSEDPDTNETRPISFTLWSLCLCHGAAAVTAVAVAKNPQFSAILDFIGGPATVPRTFYTNVTRARARRNRNGMPCDIIILSYILLAWLCYTHSLPECMEMTDHNRVLCMLTVFAYVTYINFRILWLLMVATKAPYQIAIGHFRVVMCIQKHTVNIIHFCGHPKMGCFLFEKWRMLACSSERINEQYLYLLVMSVCHLKEAKRQQKKWPERN